MIVAVTGANGYIGKQVVGLLSEKDVEVLPFDIEDWDIRLPLSL